MAIVNATDIVVKIKATAGNPTDTLLHATSASLSISHFKYNKHN